MFWDALGGFLGGLFSGDVIERIARRGRSSPKKRWSTGASAELRVALEPAVCLQRARQGLERMRLQSGPFASGDVLDAVTVRDWRTMGTRIHVAVDPHHEGSVVRVTAWPVFPGIFDWGRSRAAIDGVLNAFTESAGGGL